MRINCNINFLFKRNHSVSIVKTSVAIDWNPLDYLENCSRT